MSKRDKIASSTRKNPAFSKPESVQPLRLPSKVARKPMNLNDSPTRSALARQGSMSRLHGPREAGSPSRTRKSVTFDYQDEVIQYEAPTPSPRFTPEPGMTAFEIDAHPLPSLPPDLADFAADMDMSSQAVPVQEPSPQIESEEPSPQVTLGWDDEIEAPASPNPLMAQLDESRPKLARRVEAVMEEAPELSKKPFVRTHRAHASWGSQSSLLREGLSVVPTQTDNVSENEEVTDGEDDGYHLDRLPSLIRQESLLETQRRPPTAHISAQPLPGPSEVQRTYSQRRRTLIKMLDSNKPHVPDMIEEEEEPADPESPGLPVSSSTYDLFKAESMVLGIDPGSPQRESAQELLSGMSPSRKNSSEPPLRERPLPQLPPQPSFLQASPPKSPEIDLGNQDNLLPKVDYEPFEITESAVNTGNTDNIPEEITDSILNAVEAEDVSEEQLNHIDLSFEKPKIVDIPLSPAISEPSSDTNEHPKAAGSPEVKLESYHSTPVIESSPVLRGDSVKRLNIVKESHHLEPPTPEPAAASEASSSEPVNLPETRWVSNSPVPIEKDTAAEVVKPDEQSVSVEPVKSIETTLPDSNWVPEPIPAKAEKPEEINELEILPTPTVTRPVFSPIVVGDTPNLETISSSPFAMSMPGTPSGFAVSPTQAEIERRLYVERQAALIREARMLEPIESVERANRDDRSEPVQVDNELGDESPDLQEKEPTCSPQLGPPQLDSDLSDSGMPSPELASIAEKTDTVDAPMSSPVVSSLQPAAEINTSTFSSTVPISNSTLSIETGDSLQMSSELEQLLTPRRGYTVRESPTYVVASSPVRQRSTPVRRNGALEIGAGPRIPQAASCGQISQVSPRRMTQSASASPVRVPEHRRPRPLWAAPAVKEEPEAEVEAPRPMPVMRAPEAVVMPEPVQMATPEQVAAPAPAVVAPKPQSSALTGPAPNPPTDRSGTKFGPRPEPLSSGSTPALRELTPPLGPAIPSDRSPERELIGSEIRVPRVRPSRELLTDYKQLPPVDGVPSTPLAPRKDSPLLFNSPTPTPRSKTKFAGRLATSSSEEGRLFVRIDKVVPGLSDTTSRSAGVWLDLDNGEHCITTPEIEMISGTAQFGREYELIVGSETEAVVTTHIKWSTNNSTGTNLLSKLRRKPQTEPEWQHMVAADGSFGRCTLSFSDLSKKSFGAPTPVVLPLVNEWTTQKSLQSAGEVHLTALFVPRMSSKEALPATMSEAVRAISTAQTKAAALQTGTLIVNGRRRWCVVDDASLVVYSEAKRPRASFNLAKASACSIEGNTVLLEFRTGDVLRLEPESSTADAWAKALSCTIANPTPRSPWLNLVLYR